MPPFSDHVTYRVFSGFVQICELENDGSGKKIKFGLFKGSSKANVYILSIIKQSNLNV